MPTGDERVDDATVLQASEPTPWVSDNHIAQLRQRPTLPRKRGLLGDVSYVFTALFGIAGARKELAEVNDKLAVEKDQRDDRLLTIMRHLIADPDVELPLLERAREQLTAIEEERSRKAGAAAAAEAELESLARARNDEEVENLTAIRRREDECKQIADKLAPLEKSAAAARRKADKLQGTLEELDRAMAAKKASLVSVKGPKADPVAVEADLASLRAERADVAAEAPAIAAELDELEPKIASLKVARKEATDDIERIRGLEAEAKLRTEEKLAAVRARKAVEDRAVSEANRTRDDALRALGEQLCLDRPGALSTRLRPIDEHDVAIATLERRALELKELVEGIDRRAVTRGAAVMLAALIAAFGLLWLIFS